MENRLQYFFSIRCCSLFLLFLALSSKAAAEVIGQYDSIEHKLRSFEIRYPLILSCNVTAPDFPALKWRKNGTDVSKVASLTGRYKEIAEERKFVIEKTDAADAGTYECWVDSLKEGATFNVYANVAVRVPSNTGVVEGEKLTIHCLAVGTDPSITWTIAGNTTINETSGRYTLKEDENGIKNSILTIENIVLDDRGDYKCTATNPATEYGNADPASDTTFVRVKGKLAALWPFLGICAEVIVLCAIILIYEKRRNKTELDESDTDPNTEQ